LDNQIICPNASFKFIFFVILLVGGNMVTGMALAHAHCLLLFTWKQQPYIHSITFGFISTFGTTWNGPKHNIKLANSCVLSLYAITNLFNYNLIDIIMRTGGNLGASHPLMKLKNPRELWFRCGWVPHL
jgi:hypothetical protein